MLRFTSDGFKRLITFATDLEPRLLPHGDLCSLTDWAGKLVGAIARIAALLHLVEGKTEDPVTINSTECAIRIGEYLLAHAAAAFALMSCSPEIADAQHLLDWIERRGTCTFTRREAFEGTKGRFTKVAKLIPVLVTLAEHGFIRRAASASPSRPGRPSDTYDVNPHMTSQYSQYSKLQSASQ